MLIYDLKTDIMLYNGSQNFLPPSYETRAEVAWLGRYQETPELGFVARRSFYKRPCQVTL
jgi:hypothetical protein